MYFSYMLNSHMSDGYGLSDGLGFRGCDSYSHVPQDGRSRRTHRCSFAARRQNAALRIWVDADAAGIKICIYPCLRSPGKKEGHTRIYVIDVPEPSLRAYKIHHSRRPKQFPQTSESPVKSIKMASRTVSTAIRISQRAPAAGRLSARAAVRSFATGRPFLAAVTTSIGKTKGVEGPDISSYPPPKHLKVPSGLTPTQV